MKNMDWLNKITEENFVNSFNIKNILTDSVYYPASGIDGRAIEGLSEFSSSFIHCDYSVSQEQVQNALQENFKLVGYKLIGLKYISKNELTPNDFIPHNFPFNEIEKERSHFLQNSIKNFTPFALWAVYELDDNSTHKTKDKVKKFSILHIGGEACATFDALYIGNKINPLGIAILNSGEGYGDNWTLFKDTNSQLYKLIEYNVQNNQKNFPKYLLTNSNKTQNCFWPDYQYLNTTVMLCDTFEYLK